jgi:hypothetical protein
MHDKKPRPEIPASLMQQVAELIASYEMAMERLHAREKALDEQFEASEKFLDNQLEKVNTLVSDLREIMTEAGAARWRLSAQEALRLGDGQLQHLKKTSDDLKLLLNESCDRFERTSHSTTKTIHEAIDAFKVDEFKKYVEISHEEVKKTSTSAIAKINEILRWFQWKNLGLALGLSIISAVVIGLYIDDEWPWELHSKVVKERAAGEALMNAWPHLNQADQQYLEQKILKLSKKGGQ